MDGEPIDFKWDCLDGLERIVGIDISPTMIKTAKENCIDERVEFFCSPIEGDVPSFPFGIRLEMSTT
jgi:ubiquinone/menaquinone biosynthesis C-methylase UbiE